LKRERTGFLGSQGIKWNFTKFLIDRAGKVTRRFGPSTKPESLASAIEALLRGD
jgi:glutathione peroxidase